MLLWGIKCDYRQCNIVIIHVEGIMPSNYPVFIVQAPRLKRTYDTYEMTFAKICAVVQVICGIFSLALGIASPFECGRLGFVGYGIWSGVMVGERSANLEFRNNYAI